MVDPAWRYGLLAAAFSLGLAAPSAAGLSGGGGVKRIGHATLSDIRINGRGQTADVQRGRDVTVKFDLRTDSSDWCPKCTNQLVIGYARDTGHGWERLPGGACVFSASGRQRRGDLSVRLPAPREPGRYRIIVSAPQAYNCVRALKWRGRPAPIARLRVR